VVPPVFKTGGRRTASSAGSIPVRLRYLLERRCPGYETGLIQPGHRQVARYDWVGGPENGLGASGNGAAEGGNAVGWLYWLPGPGYWPGAPG
jgi:hypothetical protein